MTVLRSPAATRPRSVVKPATPSILLGAALLTTAVPALAQQAAHVHGLIRLDLVIDANRVSLQLDAPQEALLGHERAPRSAAEKQAAAALLAALRGPAPPWTFDAALRCTPGRREVRAPMLDPAATTPAASAHAEVSVSADYACASAPSRLDLGPLLDAYKGVTGVEARIVDANGQRKASLKRPTRVLAWGR